MSYARIVYISQIIVMVGLIVVLGLELLKSSEEPFGTFAGLNLLPPFLIAATGLGLLILIGLIIGKRRLRLRLALWLGLVGVGGLFFKLAGDEEPGIIIAQAVIGLAFAVVCVVLPWRWLFQRRSRMGERSVALSMRT